MTGVTHERLLVRPEASWAQVTLLIPVRESSPPPGPGSSQWQQSVSDFPVTNEPGVVTDEAWRSRLVASGAHETLYGGRSHCVLASPTVLGTAGQAPGQQTALETDFLEFMPTGIIPGFGPGGILIAHAELRQKTATGQPLNVPGRLPVRWLSSAVKDLTRLPAGQRSAVGIAPFVANWGLSLHPGTDIAVAVNVACPESTIAVLRPDPKQEEPWDALALWTWALARGTVPTADMLRELSKPAGPGRTVSLPHRTATVDRSGMAIMTTTPVDSDPNVARAMSDFVPVFQSVYCDTLLLGYMELLIATEVGDRLDKLADPVRHPREFHDIELRMRFLHNRVWRTRVSEWPWLNSALAAFREENGLSELITQLGDNLRDYGDQVERGFQHGLNTVILLLSALGFLGVISGIFGCVAAFMSVFGTGHWGAIVGIVGTSAGVIALCGLTALIVRKGTWQELTQYLRR